jgi:hypothetical protein
LRGHLGHDPYRGTNDLTVGASEHRRRLELGAPKRLFDLLGSLGDSAATPPSLQGGTDAASRKGAALRRRRRDLEHGQGICGGKVGAEGL